jgi:hypothetical protein
MLDTQLQHLRLIDLDNLNYDGDYIQDMALLLEDVGVFRFLFDEKYRFYLHKDQIRFMPEASEHAIIENKIEYAPFSSETTRLFQHYILRQLETYAQAIDDDWWKERLWLALANSLIYLVAKQTEKEYATVLYVEAVKLLEALVCRLKDGAALDDIPFTGKLPETAARKFNLPTLAVPAWYQEGAVLAYVHKGIMALDSNIRYELTSSGRVTQYFAANKPNPFAVIDGKKQTPSILLAGSLQTLKDPLGIMQERESDSDLRVALRVSEELEAASILRLVRQAFELSQAG